MGWKDYQNGLAWAWRQLEHFAGLGMDSNRLQDRSTFLEERVSAIIVSFVFWALSVELSEMVLERRRRRRKRWC